MRLLEMLGVGRPPRPTGIARNERIMGLSDGVFAIVITLLVLEVRVPEISEVPEDHLAEKLREMIPLFVGHVGSFVVLGIYWVGHHNMFMHIKRHDRMLMWLNILFLLFVASMPFPTGLVITYADAQLAVVIFLGTLVGAGVALDLIWWYATNRRHLVDENIDPGLVGFVHRRVLVAPLIYLIAIGLSFFSVLAAKLVFIVVALIYIVPNPLDHYHHRELAKSGQE